MPDDALLNLPPLTQFRLHEYDSVKKELLDQVKALATLFQYAIFVTAAIFGWLLTHPPSEPASAWLRFGMEAYATAWWIPLVLTALLFLQTWASISRIDRASLYIKQLESSFGATPGGFETQIERHRSSIRKTIYAGWALLFLFDTLTALLLPQPWNFPFLGY
jgi:hypothetical protein